jgi:hypothetical protein
MRKNQAVFFDAAPPQMIRRRREWWFTYTNDVRKFDFDPLRPYDPLRVAIGGAMNAQYFGGPGSIRK